MQLWYLKTRYFFGYAEHEKPEESHTWLHEKDIFNFCNYSVLVKALGWQGGLAGKKCSKSAETFWLIWPISLKLTIMIFELI